MSLKHFAMLAAISYNNQQSYSYNNNKNNNKTNNNNSNNKTTITTTLTPESATKTQQQQHQQQQQTQQITSPIFSSNTDITTTTTTTTTAASTLISSSSPFLTYPLYLDKVTTFIFDHKNYVKNGVSSDEDSMSGIISGDSYNYSSESSEHLDVNQQATPPERQPSHTYTSTTYYGSGFGVFHQQNTRSNNAGGIALISGSSAGNGLGGGGGSYSNGINNNVNLLLGGAMLTLITTILCVVCYCCHRNIKKRTEAAYRQQRQWLENDPNMEIYSVEQCYETSGIFVGESMDGLTTIPTLHHEPPPSYDAVVAMQEQQQLIMQQHQHQILMQQQLLQQQLSINNSPPPGYRSSSDVSSALQQGQVLTVGGSITSGMEINSLNSSSANLRTVTSISPIDPLLNHNDINGNVAAELPASNATHPNNRTAACCLRNKQQQQQQRNSAMANQMSQLSMKKVLQAQSCCSLQRAEVENMWNAAAAALAARSSHLASDSRASTTTSASSPTLVINTRKPAQGCKTTPETFGTRYLKQNYYRRGCPLCGKFRYDNDDSALSISMESNLNTLAGNLTEQVMASGEDNNMETTLNIVNNNESPTNSVNTRLEEADVSGNEVDNNDNEIEQQCSCLSSKLTHDLDSTKIEEDLQKIEELQVIPANEPEVIVRTAESAAPHDNANSALAIDRQSTNQAASNNNNDITNTEVAVNSPLTLVAAETGATIPRSADTAASASSETSTTNSVAINLDCINENGIISLDMSRIIDKTGLPTYDAALKLESSGYV